MSRRWPIERSWVVRNCEDGPEQISTRDLLRYRACGMLGAAGLGKTYELSYLAEHDRQRGLDVRQERLVVLGQTTDGLKSKLDVLATGVTDETVIYLDALDEVMVPVSTAALILDCWIRDRLVCSKPALRISCRSAVWPARVEAAIHEVYGKDDCAVALLHPLSREDVKSVASIGGVDGNAFVVAVDKARASALSQQPLALEMLLRIYSHRGSLPTKRNELFAEGVHLLSAERFERVDDGTAIDVSVPDLIDAAERLACLCLLSGDRCIRRILRGVVS